MRLGTFVFLDDNIKEKLTKIKEYGLTCCQLACWDSTFFTDKYVSLTLEATKETGIDITAFWCGWEGEQTWDLVDGYHTLGLVPVMTRAERMAMYKKGSDFAKKLGVVDFITHFGFLPENCKTDEYRQVVLTIRELAEYCKANGQYLMFETGQETPITLKRTIIDVGTGNLGINLDPANLLMYGKANPCDAVDVFGEYVRGIHAKDGEYPTDPYRLGKEVRIGDGRANFPLLIKKLKEKGYDGAITIEREIEGDEQVEDIIYAKKYLENIING